MLLQRHAGGADERRHDGKIAVERSNLRWCSDGFELACDNGEKVRIAFALDCCDREAMAWVATTQGIKGEDVRDLMVASVESRFGQINRLPRTIEWLSDNGSGYIAKETRAFARDIGFEPLTTPVTSPQSNGMAEAFVRTIKRDYARVDLLPDARTVIESLPLWFDHYNAVHPHSALRYQSPREFIAAQSNRRPCPVFKGQQQQERSRLCVRGQSHPPHLPTSPERAAERIRNSIGLTARSRSAVIERF